MRGFVTGTSQILAAAVAIAVVGGAIGLVVGHFALHTSAGNVFGWGMVIAGGLVGFLAGNSGSPSENLVRGRFGAFATYWSQSAAMPQSPLQLALGGLFAFAGGLALLILVVH